MDRDIKNRSPQGMVRGGECGQTTKSRGNQKSTTRGDGVRPEPCSGRQGRRKALREAGTEYAKAWRPETLKWELRASREPGTRAKEGIKPERTAGG